MFGPLLFLLYINDLAEVSKKLTLFLFADDTNIYFIILKRFLKSLCFEILVQSQ